MRLINLYLRLINLYLRFIKCLNLHNKLNVYSFTFVMFLLFLINANYVQIKNCNIFYFIVSKINLNIIGIATVFRSSERHFLLSNTVTCLFFIMKRQEQYESATISEKGKIESTT